MPEKIYMNLIKLCVGAESYEDQASRIAQRVAAGGPDYLPSHVTRMWPKQEADILKGGSLLLELLEALSKPAKKLSAWTKSSVKMVSAAVPLSWSQS